MSVNVTVRNVPTGVRNELAARAAKAGKSMQEYLLAELERLARRPSLSDWLGQVRARKSRTRTRLAAREILSYRDRDRR